MSPADRTENVVYATHGLVEALLGFAREAEPESVTIGLAVTAAGDPQQRLDETVSRIHHLLGAIGG